MNVLYLQQQQQEHCRPHNTMASGSTSILSCGGGLEWKQHFLQSAAAEIITVIAVLYSVVMYTLISTIGWHGPAATQLRQHPTAAI
jgi:hypothetical protein